MASPTQLLNVQKTILALAFTGAMATTAAVGNIAEPIMEPAIIMDATEAASSGSARNHFCFVGSGC
jgi:hypothetical protein